MKAYFFVAGALSLAVLGGCGGGGGGVSSGGGPTTLSASLATSDLFEAGRYYDIFVSDALNSGTARVAMRSSDFDTQFYVYEKNSSGKYVLIENIPGSDDADSSTSDSDGEFDVTQGNTYRILATSHDSNVRGKYQIRFSDNLSAPAQVVTNDAALAKGEAKFSLPARSKK